MGHPARLLPAGLPAVSVYSEGEQQAGGEGPPDAAAEEPGDLARGFCRLSRLKHVRTRQASFGRTLGTYPGFRAQG
jgi:hypothetical protein